MQLGRERNPNLAGSFAQRSGFVSRSAATVPPSRAVGPAKWHGGPELVAADRSSRGRATEAGLSPNEMREGALAPPDRFQRFETRLACLPSASRSGLKSASETP